jgi:hypothetical protein
MNVYKLLTAIALASTLSSFEANAQYTYQDFSIPGFTVTDVTGISGSNVTGLDGGSSVFWNGSTEITLSDPSATKLFTSAYGISGATVVGIYDTGTSSALIKNGFSYKNGAYQTINYPGAVDSAAYGADGTNIVGQYFTSSTGFSNGFLDANGTFSTIDDPNGAATIVNAIAGNTEGGFYIASSTGNENGFIDQNGTYTTIDDPLGTGGTTVTGISGNLIVGNYFVNTSNDPEEHGFVYNGSTFTTIDDPNAVTNTTGLEGTQINGITGTELYGFYVNSAGTNVVFTATVPEPDTTFLLTTSLGLLAALCLRRRQPVKRSR